MARSDGSVIIDTRMNTKGFGDGVKSMKGKIGGLMGSVGKLGAAIGLAFSVKKLIDFGKSAIDLGSDLQEVQNVVDVTFTTMNDAVNEFAKKAAESAGLSETMAKKYMGTFGAMAKAFGFAESEAFNMSTSLTQLSGDVASFYNLTQDEAYTKLKSVFTGETESLKDLGVVMTQTALDSFAMAKGYGKTTKQMNEQEKVALRYAFVLDQLSSAQGDFIRTSDGWANQTRILSLNFDSFKANVGQALINIFTPFLKILNQIVSKLAQFSQRFVAFSELIVGKSTSGGGGSPGDALAEIEGGFNNVAAATDEATKAQKKYLSGLDEIKTFSDASSDNMEAVGVGGLIKPGESTEASVDVKGIEDLSVLEVVLQKVAKSFEKLKSVFDIVWNNYLKPIISDIKGDIQRLCGAFIQWFSEKIIPVLDDVKDKFLEVANEYIWPLLDKIFGTISKAWNEMLYPFIEWLGEKLGVFLPPFIDGLGKAFVDAFKKSLEVVGFLWDALDGLIDFIVGVFTADWGRAWDGLVEVFKGIVNGLIGIFEYFVNFVIGKLNAIISGANKLSSSIGLSWEIPTIPDVEIPKLARGAVIPPNAPFMAVLGDQRHGTNIEAPLETIKQAVREVMGTGGGGSYAFTAQINRRTLFEEVIDEAKLRQSTSGRNPFELA